MKKYPYLITSICFLVIFVVFTILVKTVDVYYVSTSNYYIGFHQLNFDFGNFVVKFGKSENMKKISDVLFYVSFGYVFALGVAGLYQLIKNKSLKKVDMRLYLLLGAYLLVVVIYFLFEVMKINYSPYIEEKLYASYPSSHVFIGCSFYLLNSYTALKMLKSDKSWVNYLTYILTAVVCALLVFSRSLSLRHWLTDIIASLILVGFIYTLYIHFNHRYIKEEVVSE